MGHAAVRAAAGAGAARVFVDPKSSENALPYFSRGTAAAAILPTLGPLVGLDITSEAVRQIGSDAGAIVQAIAAFVGTLMTLYGRARATAPLVRREMNVKL